MLNIHHKSPKCQVYTIHFLVCLVDLVYLVCLDKYLFLRNGI